MLRVLALLLMLTTACGHSTLWHSGGLNSSGCHNETGGSYHCHGGGDGWEVVDDEPDPTIAIVGIIVLGVGVAIALGIRAALDSETTSEADTTGTERGSKRGDHCEAFDAQRRMECRARWSLNPTHNGDSKGL